MLVSIDPGSTAAGVAVWKKNTLRTAFLARGKTWEATALDIIDTLNEKLLWPTSVVIEVPQVYMPKYTKGDPNRSLTPLFLQAGALLGAFGLRVKHQTVLPKEWKKQTPKPIMTARVKERLSEQELGRVVLPRAKSLHHNIWDGIGIGLFATGRLGRRVNGKRESRDASAATARAASA
jgi:hypothetical protein